MTITALPSASAAAAWLTSKVTGTLRTDSRQVQPGDGFIAWPGYAQDGRKFVAAALQAGAAACLVEGASYATKKYRAWFVGMAPIRHPRIIVAVMVDEPNNGQHFGGDVAAPVFSQVVQQTLRMMNVAPDIDVKAQIAGAKAVAAEQESF